MDPWSMFCPHPFETESSLHQLLNQSLMLTLLRHFELEKIYSLPYRVALLDTKTREFQYKLLNRCLVTNTFLCKIGIIPSPACSLRGESDESLEHLFLFSFY